MRQQLRTIATFLAVTCGFSWALLAIFQLTGGTADHLLVVVLPYSMGPLAGALFLQWRRNEKAMSLLGGDPFPNAWFLLAWALPPLLALCANLVAPLVGHGSLSFDVVRLVTAQVPAAQLEEAKKNLAHTPLALFVGTNLVQALLIGATVSAAVALGEEIGWRVTLHRAVEKLGLWPASIVLGLCRAGWIAPLVLAGWPYGSHPRAGVAVAAGYSIATSVVATFLRRRGGSVLPSALFVGGLSASNNALSTVLVVGGTDLTRGLVGLPGLVLVALAAVGVSLVARPAVSAAPEPFLRPPPARG